MAALGAIAPRCGTYAVSSCSGADVSILSPSQPDNELTAAGEEHRRITAAKSERRQRKRVFGRRCTRRVALEPFQGQGPESDQPHIGNAVQERHEAQPQ